MPFHAPLNIGVVFCAMPNTTSNQLRLAELIGALSHALDLTEGQPRGHSIRCCWIGFQLGQAIGFSTEELSDLYYALLLKDLGCSSNAARICELYLTDDRSFKHDFKQIDGSLSQALRFVLGHTGLESGLAERFRAIVNIMRNGGQISRELIEARCHRGAEIAGKMRFSPRVCEAIQNLDEHWDGSGKPEGKYRRDIPQASQIALLAQVADVFHQTNGVAAAIREINARKGTWFDADLVEVFNALSDSEEFWQGLASPTLRTDVLAFEPTSEVRLVDNAYLDQIATAFAQVIDSKSPFTRGHSERVAVFTDLIAEEMGLPDERRAWLRRAALLHDIGKLAVSNSILDKPGPLDEAEFAVIKMHPVYSGEIISGISAFSDMARVARGHHEKLNGKGYPDGLQGSEIELETRIVTVADVFDAMTADRPYRSAIPVSQVLIQMSKEIGTSFDATCLDALKRALARAEGRIAA
jgi:HD-GYP domain-containing protein (c-di-GMP phosphodiesterase class II)